MKLPYSSIFRSGGSGEDGDENACGLSDAYMRFLFAVQDYPHTFWDQDSGERVSLNDAERQLLERGIASLTKLGCELPARKVASYYSPINQPVNNNTETNVYLGAGMLDTDYVVSPVLPGTIDVVVGGLFRFYFTISTDPSTQTGSFPYRIAIKRNGAINSLNASQRIAVRDTLQLEMTENLQAGDRLEFLFTQYSGHNNVILGANLTKVVGVYYG